MNENKNIEWPSYPDYLGLDMISQRHEDKKLITDILRNFHLKYQKTYHDRAVSLLEAANYKKDTSRPTLIFNMEVKPFRRVNILKTGEIVEEITWGIDFIIPPMPISQAPFIPIGVPDHHSSWIFLMSAVHENVFPVSPMAAVTAPIWRVPAR